MKTALPVFLAFMFLTTPFMCAIGGAGGAENMAEPRAPVTPLDITVQNTLDRPRTGEVIRLSVPFEMDELRDFNKIRVVNPGTQQEVPSGVLPSTIQLYPNGSIYRMDITFQDDFAARETKQYRIVSGQPSALPGSNMTVTKTATGATVYDGTRTYLIGTDASGQYSAYVADLNPRGQAQALFLTMLGGNQFTPDHVSFSILWGQATSFEYDANRVMATVHLRYHRPTAVFWNGPYKTDIPVVSADVRISFYHGRDMFDFCVTKTIKERIYNHNGFLEEATVLLGGDDNYELMFGNSRHTVLTGNTKSYTIKENTNVFPGVSVSNSSAPAFADWNADGLLEMVIGDQNGTLTGYRNAGNRTNASWAKDLSVFSGISAGGGGYAAPELADVNGDGLVDLVVGRKDGTLACYRNTGSASSPAWTADTSTFSGIDAGDFAAPALDDLDRDGDPELAIGESGGGIVYYKNTGTKYSPAWARDTATFYNLNNGNTRKPGTYSDPDFADVNFDGKADLISGLEKAFWMATVFYFNTGTPASPKFTDLHNQWFDIVRMYEDAGDHTHPEFADLNGDGNADLVVGRQDGTLKYYEFVGNTTPERKGSDMVPLQNGSYRYFYDLGQNEGQYEIVDEDPVFKDYYTLSAPKANRTVLRYIPDFKRLANRDRYYEDAYPWAGGNVSWYPYMANEDGYFPRGIISMAPFSGGASVASFYSQTGWGNGFIMVPVAPMDYTSREVLLNNLPSGMPPSYYDNQTEILATPLVITSPPDLCVVPGSFKIEPNKGGGDKVLASVTIRNLGGSPVSDASYTVQTRREGSGQGQQVSGNTGAVPAFGSVTITISSTLSLFPGTWSINFQVGGPNNELDKSNNILKTRVDVPFVSRTLSPIYQVSGDPGNSVSPDIAVDSSGKPWVTWSTYGAKESWDVGVSSFGGSSWGPTTWLSKDRFYSLDPAIAARPGSPTLWVVYTNNYREHQKYVDGRSAKEYWNTKDELYLSQYDGSSWSTNMFTAAFDSGETDQAPDVALDGQGAAWVVDRHTRFDLYAVPGEQIHNQPFNDQNILGWYYNNQGPGVMNFTLDNSAGAQGWWNGPTVSIGSETWFIWDSDIGGSWSVQSRKYNVTGLSAVMPVTIPAGQNGMRPSIAADNTGNAWAVFESQGARGISIYACRYNGTAWSTPELISNGFPQEQKAVVVLDSVGNPWVAWESWRDGNKEIYMRHYNGLFWSEQIRITDDTGADEEPALAAGPNGAVWVTWESDRSGLGHFQIYARKITTGTTYPKIDSLSASPDPAFEDDNMTLNGVASSAAGKVVRFDWDLDGDGVYEKSSSQSWQPKIAFNQSGVYMVRFRVVNEGDLAVQSDWLSIIVRNKPPVPDAGADLAASEDETVFFNGSGSNDTPSDMALGLEYSWSFGDGNTTTWSRSPMAQHAFTSAGVYRATLFVRDDDLAVANASIDVSIRDVMPNATLEVGNLTGVEDETLTFVGSGSDTPSDIASLVWMWDFGDGSISEWGRELSVGHAYKDQGEYRASLTVKDDEGLGAATFIKVTIRNLSPKVHEVTGPDAEVSEDEQITFTGSGTDTPSDVAAGLQYRWDLGDGTVTNWTDATELVHTFTTAGVHTVTFTVRDNNNATGSQELDVTVVNPPPTVHITSKMPKSLDEDTMLQFKASGTDTASDHPNLTYVWDFGDGTGADGAVMNHSYNKAKTYTVTVTVTDDEGAKATETARIAVSNVPPVAKASADRTTVRTGESVKFNSEGTTDTRSDITTLEYRWSFSDGGSATGPNATHTFTSPGSQKATLTVTDDEGGTSTAVVSVNVNASGGGGGGGGGGGSGRTTLYAATAGIIIVVLLVLAFILFRRRGKGASPEKQPNAPPQASVAEAPKSG